MPERRSDILDKIGTPLRFFALVLLAVEAVILLLGVDVLMWGMIILMFLTAVVAFITFFRPEALSGKSASVSNLRIKNTEIGNRSNEQVEPALIFSKSDDDEFSRYFKNLISNAKRITLIGTGINILHRDPLFEQLMTRVENDRTFQLEIYAANPFSPSVETRLIEEDAGSPKPRIGKQGLIQFLEKILEEQKKLKYPPNLSIQLFSHYPTLALFIIEEDGSERGGINKLNYLSYPYGYAQLGTFSPVVHYSSINAEHKPMIDFFEGQYTRIKNSAINAKLIFDIKEEKFSSEQLDQLKPFAVYFIPDEDSPLYCFGSDILGYDIQKRKVLENNRWTDYVGGAKYFGFHLTIADALYYVNKNQEIELILKEISFVSKELHPFSINFTIEKDFPNKQSISLVCKDESGVLEALHFEMVHRCYRKAVGSNYNLKGAKADRDADIDRARLMIKRYNAPYIIQRFKPHFTLLTKVPPEKKDELFQELKLLFEEKIGKSQIEVKKIALMIQSKENQPWEIKQEIKLGG